MERSERPRGRLALTGAANGRYPAMASMRTGMPAAKPDVAGELRPVPADSRAKAGYVRGSGQDSGLTRKGL